MDVVHVDLARVARELQLRTSQVENAVALLDEGNTVPFITRYRKERTDNLDEEQLRAIQARVSLLRQVAERAATILRLIEAQGKLTPELRRQIEQADSLKRLDDLYLPYRPKKRSRASTARERGLEPLAERILRGEIPAHTLTAAAAAFVRPDAVPDAAAALDGAADIVAERFGDDASLRAMVRKLAWQTGRLMVAPVDAAAESAQAYRDYFGYTESVTRIPPHRTLAINRGEQAAALRVRFDWDDAAVQQQAAATLQLEKHPCREFLERCLHDALGRLIQPSLDREIRRELTEHAEEHAVAVFARNLRQLLLQPPVSGQRLLAIDPGFRTGCKIVVLDEIGQCQAADLIYCTGSAEKRAAAKSHLAGLIRQHACTLIAIGNGTACRETEELVAELIAEELPELRYAIVNEAGASVYSASAVAREEFPQHDATVRGTISIGRRLQDPLSELVKIEPQHLGVGMYQHDVSAKRLEESLEQVIESCVNFVGVDLNTAGPALLSRVSGLNQLTARRVVEWRAKHGRFTSRRQLLEVAGVGERTFLQAAGFLKIAGGDEPLDRTWIHPESYPVARQVLQRLELAPDELNCSTKIAPVRERLATLDPSMLAGELQVGLPTLRDILDAIARPGRDPRGDLQGPLFKKGVLKLEDLAPGMELQGQVLNVVDFGAFVDVGLKDSGLVHISQMATRFVKSPHEVVAVGDRVTVWVQSVDMERRRIALTMVSPGSARKSESAPAREPAHSPPATPQPSRAPAPPPPARTKPPAVITPDKATGRTPLRGFDELKQLWNDRHG